MREVRIQLSIRNEALLVPSGILADVCGVGKPRFVVVGEWRCRAAPTAPARVQYLAMHAQRRADSSDGLPKRRLEMNARNPR